MAQTTDHKGPLRRFFGTIGGAITWLRRVFTNLLFLLILLFIGKALFSGGEAIAVPQGAALRVAPGGYLVDELTNDPVSLGMLLGDRSGPMETRVKDLVDAIDGAVADERISSIVLELDSLVGAELSKLGEVGKALQRFKDSGKPIYAVGDNYTQAQYYLASFADTIYLNPMGSLLLTGFGAYRDFYKSALDKLKVNFHVFRVGDYKSAIEPFIRDDMSPAARENARRWLYELWGEYTQQVTNQRDLPDDAVDNFIDNLPKNLRRNSGSWAATALEYKFVDQLSDRLTAVAELQKAIGISNKDKTEYESIDALDYLKSTRLAKISKSGLNAEKIALITATGNIVDGEGKAGQIGSHSLSKQIQQARENQFKALVLRIDSGGGSAFASEVIRKELLATRKAGIPVVISMGSVAASGGYWVASAGDRIWASPSTITGSIGVFGAFPTFEDSLAALGVYNDGVGTTEMAGAMRLDRPLSESAAEVIQLGVEDVYGRFLHIVAEARDSTPQKVNNIAQGQVWAGRSALELGLVDELGGLKEAIAGAAQLVKLENYRVEEIQPQLSPGELLMRALTTNMDAQLSASIEKNLPLGAWLSSLQPVLAPMAELQHFRDPRGLYARCLACKAP